MRLKILTTLLVATVATFSSVHAQMKVGDNPNSVAGNAAFQVEKNGKQVLVDTTGKLGIGTLAPTRKLEIYGVAAEPALYLHTSGNDSVSGGQILFRESDPGYGVNLRHYTGNGTINGRANSVEGLYFEGVVNGVTSTTLMVDQNNNRVGLGTNNPSTTLEIDSKTANVSGLKFTSLTSATPTSTGQAIGVDASGNVVTVAASVASSNSWFNAATNTAATANTQDIYQMGKVSVGAVSATSKFAVVSDGAGSGAADDVEIASYNSSPSIGLYLKSAGGTKAAPVNLANGNQLGNIVFQGQAGGAATDLSTIAATYQGNGTTTLSDLTFKTSNANRMYIGSGGNVGIGTSSPANALHVNAINPLRLDGLQSGSSATDKLMVADATGVVKEIGTLDQALASVSVPKPALFELERNV